jgi:predicted PurR-regulated permease PerM
VRKLIKPFHSGRAVFFLMIFISIIIAAAVLKLAAAVILPFIIAFLLALTMFPLITLLDKLKVKRIFSVLLCVIIIGVALFILGVILFTSGKAVIHPDLYEKYEARLTEIYTVFANLLELPNDESLSFWQNLWGQLGIRTWVYQFATSSFTVLINFITKAIMVTIFMAFILLEASFLKEKLLAAFYEKAGGINKMGQDLMSQVIRYLTAKFIISLATGIITAVGLRLIKVDFAIVWGLIAFILNFIPTFGSIAAGFITSLFALIQFWPEPVPVILTVVLIISINVIIGSIIDPKLIGDHVGISPLVVLGSLTIWGFIWGFAGMVIAVPMTVIIKIICENVPYLEPVSILLGSRRATLAIKAEPEKTEESAVDVIEN